MSELSIVLRALSQQLGDAETRVQARQQLSGMLDAVRQGKAPPLTPAAIDDALAALDLPQDTFVYLVMLAFKLQTAGTANQLFVQQATALIFNGSEDAVRANPEQFKLVTHTFAETCIASALPAAAVRALEVAIRKLAPSPDHLTPIHADFVKVALLSRHYHAAQAVLDRTVFEIDVNATALDPKDSLLYFYYGGMAYIGTKQFEKAHDFLLMAITSPAQVLSAIVVEAFKKYCLVSLLLSGKIAPLPKFTAPVVSRALSKSGDAYVELGKAVESSKVDEAEKVVGKFSADFEKDRNMGLVRQVVESVTRRNIQRLTQTYVTLSLSDIAKAVQLHSAADAQAYIMRMIDNGEITARIDPRNQMVSFEGVQEAYDVNAAAAILDERMHSAMRLGDRIALLDRRINISEDYIKKVLAADRGDAKAFDLDDSDLLSPPERVSGGMRLQ